MPGTPRMIIVLTKLGRNCQVVFNNSNGNTQTFQEDSANIECNYNQINDFVTVGIKGRTAETTSSIVFDNVLYINSGSGDVLIKTYADFLINYALLFLNSGGGSGGFTTADNGLTANSTNVKLGGPLINDTFINANNYNFNISDVLKLDLEANQYTFGDYAGNYADYSGLFTFSGNAILKSTDSIGLDSDEIIFYKSVYSTKFIVSPLNNFIASQNNNNNYGIELNFSANEFTFGNYNGNNSFQPTGIKTNNNQINLLASSKIIIDFENSIECTRISTGDKVGINIDTYNGIYSFGNKNASANDFNIDDFQNTFKFRSQNDIVLNLFNGNQYQFGSTINNWNIFFDQYLNNFSINLGSFTILSYVYDNTLLSNITGSNILITSDRINFTAINSFYNFSNVKKFVNNADAIANGYVVGDIYYSIDTITADNILKIVQ